MKINAKELLSAQNVRLEFDDRQLSMPLLENLKDKELFLAPGLIDLQVNGYKGVDFNADTLSVEKIENATLELLKDGVTGFLPTLITNDPVLVEKNIGLFCQAMERNQIVKECVLGFHMEGPFISSADGSRGAHPVEWILKPDLNILGKWQEISGNRIKLITLSPEYEKSIDFIKTCKEKGIKVAIGHSNASSEQIMAAIDAGASLSTHLGNAMPMQIHRHKNTLFDQIANDDLYASIIADGHHLSDSLLKIICRSRPGKVFLVSDATMFTGMKPGVYDSNIGGKVKLDKDGKLSILDNEEYLAGGASSLTDCVNVLLKEKLFTLAKAWELASLTPYRYLFDEALSASDYKNYALFSYQEDTLDIVLTSMDNHLYSTYF